MSERCEYAGKVPFSSKRVAREALLASPMRSKRVRVYFCAACAGYHITKEGTTRLSGSRTSKMRKKVLD